MIEESKIPNLHLISHLFECIICMSGGREREKERENKMNNKKPAFWPHGYVHHPTFHEFSLSNDEFQTHLAHFSSARIAPLWMLHTSSFALTLLSPSLRASKVVVRVAAQHHHSHDHYIQHHVGSMCHREWRERSQLRDRERRGM